MSVEGFFTAQVLALGAVLAWLLPPRWRWRGVLLMAVWLFLTALIAASGLLAFGPLPPRILPLVFAATIGTTALGLSRVGRAWAAHAGLPWLIGFQVFRVAVEIFLWWGHREGLVPGQMTWEGRNFDVLTGLTAPGVAWLVHRGSLPRAGVLAWNWLGLALLVNIVTVAILSMPTPVRVFPEPNTFVAQAPYVWLPVFLVQAAWLGHLLVFRWPSPGKK